MDNKTTSISDLPIDRETRDNSFPDDAMRLDTTSHMLDEHSYLDKPRFNDGPNTPYKNYSTNSYLSDIEKTILISTLLFILFREESIKTYIYNLLDVFLGKLFQQEDRYQNIIYGIVFGFVLYMLNRVIDIKSINI